MGLDQLLSCTSLRRFVGAAAKPSEHPARKRRRSELLPSQSLWAEEVPRRYDLLVRHWHHPAISTLVWPAGAGRVSATATLHRLVAATSSALVVLAVRMPWPEPLLGEVDDEDESLVSLEQPCLRDARPFVRLTQGMPLETAGKIYCSPHDYLFTAVQPQSPSDILLFRAGTWEAGMASSCQPDGRLPVAPGDKDSQCEGLAWLPETRGLLATSMPSGHVRLWNVEVLSGVADFHTAGRISDLSASPGEAYGLLACCTDGAVRLFDARGGSAPSLVGSKARCAAFASCSVGSGPPLLATGSTDGTVKIWELRQPNKELAAMKTGGSPLHISWAPFPAGRGLLAASLETGSVELWDATSQSTSPCFVHNGHCGQTLSSVAWSHDAAYLLATCALPGLQEQDSSLVSCPSSGSSGNIQFWKPTLRVSQCAAK